MKAKDIIKNILPGKSAYDKTLYLLYNYRDLKEGEEINEESREVMRLMDKAVEKIGDDKYISIILLMKKGYTVERISNEIHLELKSTYKHRKRLIKRLSIVIYGDVAL